MITEEVNIDATIADLNPATRQIATENNGTRKGKLDREVRHTPTNKQTTTFSHFADSGLLHA
jgi:hypothetical protein